MTIEEATSYAILAMFSAGMTRDQALDIVRRMCDEYELRRPDQALEVAVKFMADGIESSLVLVDEAHLTFDSHVPQRTVPLCPNCKGEESSKSVERIGETTWECFECGLEFQVK